MADLEVTFTGVHVYKRNHVVVPAVVDEYADENRDHAMIFRRFDGKWYHRIVDNSIGGIFVIEEPRPKVLSMGVDGQISVQAASGVTTEVVDSSPDGPNRSAFLRCIRLIGEHVYVAGMARQVYRREQPDRWVRIDRGVFVPRDQRRESIGFNGTDGLREDAIYAVGYRGEIWYYDGRGWTQLDSPTNVVLTVVRCIAEDTVYVAGMAGTLLVGSRSGWDIVAQDATTEDFWGMAWFRERLYVSGYDGIFMLVDDALEPVDMRLGRTLSTAYLDAGDEVLWSVGQKDLAYTEDGATWVELDKP